MSDSNTTEPREFRDLITQLQSPTAKAETSSLSRYPWSDEEMIARYGMRYATPEERRIFPRKRLVISVGARAGGHPRDDRGFSQTRSGAAAMAAQGLQQHPTNLATVNSKTQPRLQKEILQ